jgi:adenine C2-methylase RlmN of 23S rRNA A2503 and tRNA A37
LHQLIYKNKAKEIQDCAQLPKLFRDSLETAGWSIGRAPIHHVATSSDGTAKILLQLVDDRLVETVGIPVEETPGANRLTACVSSQVYTSELHFPFSYSTFFVFFFLLQVCSIYL